MNTALRVIRILCVIVFISGIAGLIISSIAGNNVGVVTTIGLITSLAAVILLTASTVANRQRLDAFNDVLAEQVEAQITSVVASGAKEETVRKLVRDAINLGRSAS
jgi:hypothetical protein